MALYAAGVTILLLAALHIALLLWAGRNIFYSKFSGFEKAGWALLCLALPLLGVGLYASYAKDYLTKKELLNLVLAVVLLGFVFSFRLWGTEKFSASEGFLNWMRMAGLALVTLFVHVWAQKGMARHFDGMARFRLWKLAGLLSIALAFLTNGVFKWAAIGCIAIESWMLRGPSLAGDMQSLGFYQKAKIVATGAFASIGLAALAKFIGSYFGGEIWTQLLHMNIWFAIFSIIPFVIVRFTVGAKWSQMTTRKKNYDTKDDRKAWLKWSHFVILRNIADRIGGYQSEGEYLFFGSRLLWVFTAVFVIISSLLLLLLGPVISILIAAVLAVAAFATWHHYLEPGPHRWR